MMLACPAAFRSAVQPDKRKFLRFVARTVAISEQALLLVKPDAVERDLTGDVFRRVKEAGLSIKQLRTVTPIWGLVEEHYDEHRGKDFLSRWSTTSRRA
jgi:hypothetical protein